MPGIVLRLTFDNSRTAAAFIDEFKRMPGVQVSYGDRPLTHLSLRDTFAAMSELEICQAALLANSGAGSGSDLFAELGSSDPFR